MVVCSLHSSYYHLYTLLTCIFFSVGNLKTWKFKCVKMQHMKQSNVKPHQIISHIHMNWFHYDPCDVESWLQSLTVITKCTVFVYYNATYSHNSNPHVVMRNLCSLEGSICTSLAAEGRGNLAPGALSIWSLRRACAQTACVSHVNPEIWQSTPGSFWQCF